MYGNYLYGTLAYSDTPTDEDLNQFIPTLMPYLPPYYYRSRLMKAIQESNAKEIAKVRYTINNVKLQQSIDTATRGLIWWERDLGIKTDLSKPDVFRREIIKAKLRGRGTVTKKLIKNTAESFANAEVDVIEHPSEYSFTIKFIGIKGIPPNMAGLMETIENIKPAHLLYHFEYTYTWWEKLKELTWEDARPKTWNDLRVY
ncbi:YmfQ family protein [Priestia abyssalis]|uniref:YmfQ family protein n=1 Tax=Priestia abyssalis TaxID=1221450 RepID=UPI001F1F3205|nr:YmfQ family protein [Priestia abyssalis]